MRRKSYALLVGIVFLFLISSAGIYGADNTSGYQSPGEIIKQLKTIAGEHKDIAVFHDLGQSPGGRNLAILELGDKNKEMTGIMVVANMEGNCPAGSRAAVKLSQLLTGEWREELASHRWYIMAVGNPDGYARFFDSPRFECFRNDRPVNDDNDDAIDEDGPDDLNGDGYITTMRQKHPEGEWIIIESNPLLMKEAETGKGEKGVYRLFAEGVDNDGDGRINEDGPGGVNPGHNFPHEFRYYTASDGLWPVSEPETRAVAEFAFAHQDIAMMITFGRANTVRAVPEGSKKAVAAQDKYKIPERMAKRMGLDPETEYPLKELVEIGRELTGYPDLTEEMVLQFLGVGAAVNPDRNDLPYWNEISERYKKFIEEVDPDVKRLDPPGFPSGSIDEWAYYQYGVPTFGLDFWTLPEVEKKEEAKEEGQLTPDEIEKMTNEEFIELGPEKIAAFLKASGAPAQFTADMVISGLKGGMVTTKKMAEMMREKQKKEESGGADATEEALFAYRPEAFLEWKPFTHPRLGEVEIGGMIPYAAMVPPAVDVDEHITRQLPFVRTLAGLLPDIAIAKIKVENISTDVWRVEAWVTNDGFLPYPTHQGKRCRRPVPIVATLSGSNLAFLEGRERMTVDLLGGSGGFEKVGWVVRADAGGTLKIKAFSPGLGTAEQAVTLKGGGR